MVKPWQIILYILTVFAFLFGITFLSGEDGIDLGFTSLKYPTTEKFLAFEKVEHADIDTLMEVETIDESDTAATVVVVEDTMEVINNSETSVNVQLIINGVTEHVEDDGLIRRIEYGEGQKQLLWPFFEKLERIKSDRSRVRIVHYGDSQIEGDRMTAYIRQRLQSMFGGTGPGFTPLKPIYNQITVDIEHSENWNRYAVFDGLSKGKVEGAEYGLWMQSSRFTLPLPDSLVTDTIEPTKAWVNLGSSKITYANARTFNQIKLHYTNCFTRCTIKVLNNGEVLVQDTLIPDGNYHVYTLNVAETPSDMRFEFESTCSPDFLGFSLDAPYGVSVDNVAMRGSSGTIFNRINYALFDRMADDLGVELYIIQFGGNGLAAIKNEEGATNYANWLKSQIATVKRTRPNAQIIFLGPSDMSTLIEGERVTYPLMEYQVDEFKRICFESGVAYWDIYRAMGGKNSMPTWVENDLAAPDYIHFSNGGAKLITEILVKALLLEYQDYKAGKSGGGNPTEEQPQEPQPDEAQ